jgi:hypothetical protein
MLSFLGSGAGFIIYFTAGIFFNKLRQHITEIFSIPDTSRLTHEYFLIFSILFAFSFFGAFKMWNLKKSGFLIYVASQLAIMAYPLVIMGPQAFSSVVMIFSLLFIFLYASQFGKMKNHSLED